MKERRRERINSLIRKVVSQCIATEVKDPRVGFVTVIAVQVSDDMREAKVHISVMGNDVDKRQTLRALNHMRGYLQKDLGDALRTRNTPVLNFSLDETTDRVSHMEALIAKARGGDADHQGE